MARDGRRCGRPRAAHALPPRAPAPLLAPQAVGHLYYYWEDVFPALSTVRGWSLRRPLGTPYLLHVLFGTQRLARAAAAADAQVANVPPPP